MDIFIKSFNRVYYLNKCLHSISVYLKNFDGRIYILDDGTPKKYLNAIQDKYPDVIILKSNYYKEKSILIQNKNDNLPKKIPSEFWYNSVKLSSDYCMILEDDLWFTETIDIKALEANSKQENIILLKFFWLANSKLIINSREKVLEKFVLYKPDLRFKNSKVYRLIYAKYNKIWRQTLTFFKLYSKESELNYYSIYSVAGAIYRKDYFLKIWENCSANVDEKEQIINALDFCNRNSVTFGRTKKEIISTGFMSSAFTKKSFQDFSIHDFNSVLNDYWIENRHVFENDLQNDINENEIKHILALKNKSDKYINQWENWVFNFKESYRKIGCKV